MRVARAFVEAALVEGAEIALDERAAHHVVRVLRRRRGDALQLFDGSGRRAGAEITSAHRRYGCRVRVGPVEEAEPGSPLTIELVQAMAKGEKMDWVVQKATELGVATIRPVITRRSEVRPGAVERRMERWREIAIAACEQSGRDTLPGVHSPVELSELAPTAQTRLLLSPDAGLGLAEVPVAVSVCVAIGPEGGFDPSDVALLADAGFEAVALGPRILRTETSALAAVAVLQSRFGDLRSPTDAGESTRDG